EFRSPPPPECRLRALLARNRPIHPSKDRHRANDTSGRCFRRVRASQVLDGWRGVASGVNHPDAVTVVNVPESAANDIRALRLREFRSLRQRLGNIRDSFARSGAPLPAVKVTLRLRV